MLLTSSFLAALVLLVSMLTEAHFLRPFYRTKSSINAISSARNRIQLRMISSTPDYANVTREDLIFNDIKRDIESDLSRTISSLFDQKLAPITSEVKALGTELSSEIKALDTKFSDKISALDTKLSSEIKTLDTKFSDKISALEIKIYPLANIYLAALVAGSSLLTYIIMSLARVNWTSINVNK